MTHPEVMDRGFAAKVAAIGRWQQRWTGRHDRYHWKRARLGAVPSGAVAHGHEVGGEPLWVCRAYVSNGLHPGKVRPAFGGALIAWNGGEVRVDEYEVLMEPSQWQEASFGTIPEQASACGYEATGETLFVARAAVAGGDLQPGKIRHAFGARAPAKSLTVHDCPKNDQAAGLGEAVADRGVPGGSTWPRGVGEAGRGPWP